ncbi:steroid 17-alpha-hydroxylase/17,20 lyase-like [Glandiceps talaboti]
MHWLDEIQVLYWILILTFVAVVVIFISFPPSHHGMPPGPCGLPLLGCVFSVGRNPHKSFVNLAKKYGDIFSIKLGSHNIVVLNSIELVKEALLKKENDFMGRPYMYSIDIFTQGGKDIIFGDFGPTWKLHRKISHSAMRSYASGETLENLITEDVFPKFQQLVEMKGDDAFDIQPMLMLVICNIMATVCFNCRYSMDDQDFLDMIKLTNAMVHGVGNGLLADFIHWAKYLPTPGPATIQQLTDQFTGFLRRQLDHHRENFDPDNLKDLTDHLLYAQMDVEDKRGGKLDSVTDTHIVQTLADMFGGGIDTSLIALNWCVIYMAEYPHIQDNVANEIDAVISQDRPPKLSDRGSLPYCEAVIHEVMRIQTVAPLAIPHSARVTSTIGGYKVPQGTSVIINLWALHNDERQWSEPREFRPDRFFDSETRRLKAKPVSYMPFGAGRRVCLGECMAKAQLFLLFVSLFQHFTIVATPGKASHRLDGFFSIFANHPQPYKVCVKKRSSLH